MISVEHVRTMARYNRWQNRSLYAAADSLTDAQRRESRGAFFGSVHGTLSHLMWGDRLWMARFEGKPRPHTLPVTESPTYISDWAAMKAERASEDQRIIAWADGIDPASLYRDLTWTSGIAGSERTRPLWLLITHFYNHQTHHRGQVHALLTGLGAKPDDTDLIIMPAA
ncbi:MAG TPA: DinB family protein [Hyphomicrobiaceae bacterium]|nr:DinB family protein [Hyphomicrobiaceae bacterium]